jgi:hypothetical protein
MKYLSLKTAKANKIGQRSQGDIHYQILTDPSHQQLYLFITGNDEDGYYSKEVVPFEKVEQCLQGIKPNSPLSSQLFKQAFIGQSSNNAAFLAAILRNEKLIQPVVDAVRKHSLQPGWDSWKAALLKNAAKAKAFEPELAKASKGPVTDSDNAELDDDEMELLQRSSTKRPESRP